MAEVMAGFVCGFAMSIAVTPAIAVAIVRARTTSPLAARLAPEGTNLLALSVVINMFLVLTLTAIGLLFGLMLHGVEESNPEGGLGSPNRLFTAFILFTIVIAVLPLAIASARLRWPLVAFGLFFAATFAWFMPYLASWSPIEQ